MQTHRYTAETQQRNEVMQREGLGLEYRLHQGHIDESELDNKRDRDGGEEHRILEETTADAAILKG